MKKSRYGKSFAGEIVTAEFLVSVGSPVGSIFLSRRKFFLRSFYIGLCVDGKEPRENVLFLRPNLSSGFDYKGVE